MIQRLRKEGQVLGYHFCTLNLEKSVRKVLEGLQWIGDDKAALEPNKLIAVSIYSIC